MSNEKRPFWENSYAQLEAETFGEPAEELAQFVHLLPRGASVLDLGCGEGRNALYLAEKGFQVQAVDISVVGLEKLNQLAQRRGLSVATQAEDMRHYAFAQSYELVLAHGSLHLIEREHWTRLIHEIKAHTRTGGYNVLVVFTDRLAPPEDLRDFHVGLFREGELFDFYCDWEVILRRSYILEDEHPGNIKHRHPINQLIARKL
jgi:tellurite methyltransferase